jgi:hypothetical protein
MRAADAYALLAVACGLLVARVVQPKVQRLSVPSGLSSPHLEELLRNHSILHVGGQHRGGTTLLWAGLGTHPDIASHGAPEQLADDSDMRTLPMADGPPMRRVEFLQTMSERVRDEMHSEGIFLQSVYPRFMLEHSTLFHVRKRVSSTACRLVPSLERVAPPWLRPWVTCRRHEGIGSYALAASSRLGSSHPLVSRESALALFDEWSSYWDLRRPVLLEKSPSNALTCGMLGALWAAVHSRARFVFLTRHPIMQSLAMEALTNHGDLATEQLVDHWVAVENAIRSAVLGSLRAHQGAAPREAADDDHRGDHRGGGGGRPANEWARGSVAMLYLEALAQRPRATVEMLLMWIGLRVDDSGGGGGGGAEAARRANPSVLSDVNLGAGEEEEDEAAARACDDAGDADSKGVSKGEGVRGVSPRWCSLPVAREWLRGVRTRPNRKYAREYLRRLWEGGATVQQRHNAMCTRLGPRVAAVSGYVLCPAEESGYEQPPTRDDHWWQRWTSEEADCDSRLAG